jgi:acetolactate synthase I/II/III large subunit
MTEVPARDFDQVADAFLELAAAHGADKAFVNPGTDSYPLQEAWARRRELGLNEPEPVLCTHEFTAVSAAHGYYLVSGCPQLVSVHVDAGTANAAGALGNAANAQAGMVLCAGKIPYTCDGTTRGGRDNYVMWSQDPFDQTGLVRPYVKWHAELGRPENAAAVVGRAFQMAANEPAGPVYLTLPREVLMAPAPGVRMPDRRDFTPASPPAPDPDAVEKAARLLLAAERPLIVAGRNGKQPDSVRELTALAEALGAAIVDGYEYMNVPGSHPLNMGPALERMLPDADAVLFVESRVPYVPCEAAPAPGATLIHLERDPIHKRNVAWDFPADLRITADCVLGLRALRAAVAEWTTAAKAELIAERRAAIAERHAKELYHVNIRGEARQFENSLHPEWVIWCLKQVLPDSAILLEDAVTSRMYARAHLTREEPGTLFTSGGACLGWSVNAAIGCKLAAPDRTVVSLVGDGGFTFANPVAALWTAEHAGAPSLTVVLNNGGYLAAQAPVKDLYPGGAVERLGDAMVTRIQPRPDYAGVAEACGALGIKVRRPTEVEPALHQALDEVENGRSAVIDMWLGVI